MSDLQINAERFFQRLDRLQQNIATHKTELWGSSDAVCIPLGTKSEDTLDYSKSQSLHIYLMGYEFPDSIILITRNAFYFMATAKKCKILQEAISAAAPSSLGLHFLERKKEVTSGINREHFNSLINAVRKNGGKKLGSLLKANFEGAFIKQWQEAVELSTIETFDVANALGLFFAVKDEVELVSYSFLLLFTRAMGKRYLVLPDF